MKKLLAIFAAAALLACSAACSSKKADEKVLRVGMECAYAPYNWTQSDDSNGAVQIHGSTDYANGYDVQMAKYLADKIGYKLEIYKMEWTSLPTAVQTGTIDCAIAGQSITAKRLETMDFTTPYYYASIVALTRGDSKYATAAGLSELDGATCTSQMGTVWYDVCLDQIPNANKLPAMEATSDMLVSLRSGKCDLLVMDMPAALASVAAYSDLKLLDFTGNPSDNFKVSDEEINIGISVRKGNTELLKKLNEALATLTTDDFAKMMDEAIANQPLSQ
jgi:ABC-type amino acid transport substrate-binding protein